MAVESDIFQFEFFLVAVFMDECGFEFAFSLGAELLQLDLGIDCESLDRDFSAVEKKALSEEEIEDLDEDRKNEQLAIYWCAK
ncbi:MAG: 4'-phosphopantetheinyl transferase superfamily protein, partial [Bacteroidales bacterium]|nr:4'-phosphopantetheinyl transferase superfamily protein [Bacteroidales bacterium]